jgi:MFS family permease
MSTGEETATPATARRFAISAPTIGYGETFRALRHRDFRLFWVGQAVSTSGTWMQQTGQAWLVLQLTNSPFALGGLMMFQTLPVMILGLFGGVIADRFPKRKLLLFTQSVMLSLALLLGFLTWTGQITLWQIYAAALTLGVMNAMDNPSRQTMVSELVPDVDLPNAVALNSMAFNIARLIGPAIGGVTIALVGVAGCYFLNASTFIATIVGLLMLHARPAAPAPDARRGAIILQVREGLRYALTTPEVCLVIIVMAAIGCFGYNFAVILPLIAQYILNAEPAAFGLLSSAIGVGSLIGSVVIARHGEATRKRLLTGAVGFSLLLLGLALSSSWIVMLPLLVVLGVFSILFSSTANIRLQKLTPPHLRGRVMSIYMLLFMGSAPIGSLVVGTLAEQQGVRVAIAEMAGICLLGVAAALLYLRRMRIAEADAPESQRVGTPATLSS